MALETHHRRLSILLQKKLESPDARCQLQSESAIDMQNVRLIMEQVLKIVLDLLDDQTNHEFHRQLNQVLILTITGSGQRARGR